MVRLLIFVIVVLAIGSGFAWLADRPGDLLITWQGREIEMSLTVGIALVLVAVVVILLLAWLVRALLASPHRIRRGMRNRRRDRGYAALSRGLIAAGAGDAVTARKMNKRSQTLIEADREPLIHLLEAQTALIEGNHDAARAKFEEMAERKETRELGLRGLYLEARRLGSEEAAHQYADRAVEAAPQLPWAAEASLEYRSREKDWDGAIRLLDKQRDAKIVKREDADRLKAVLLTARAMERIDREPHEARSDAEKAVKLAPTLVPAAVIAARACFRDNHLRRGMRTIEKCWKDTPHPELAEAYVFARQGDSARDRLRRAERLESVRPDHVESSIALAHAALDAQEFSKAREKAEEAARVDGRESVYLLLADIEEAETGDQGRVRHWLGQAVRANRDPAWTADGYVAEHWAPVSPVTGKLDAFEWRVPVEQLHGAIAEGHTGRESEAEHAIRTLPPVSEPAGAPDDVKDQAVDVELEKPVERAKPVEDEKKSAAPHAGKAKPEPVKEEAAAGVAERKAPVSEKTGTAKTSAEGTAAEAKRDATTPPDAAARANGARGTDEASATRREADRSITATGEKKTGEKVPTEKTSSPGATPNEPTARDVEIETGHGKPAPAGTNSRAVSIERPGSTPAEAKPGSASSNSAGKTEATKAGDDESRRAPDDPGTETDQTKKKRFGLF
ncbi:heme biosynthesis protein HemY [Pararhizobium mangrovi]|uniref:Heme biosynthesis protein HemY n=1 Tax=Pararhizobium mangrovi TaxID=2590452 RepID=A0A506U2Q7_9HYPH|nr:heme biosynthesis protein HemY [Pararhizobium mangrovi]TPW27758.1 heme biosynthesis protein HemY [Pararhizobium mangrovi]